MPPIINCHTHLFTSRNVPDRFIPYPAILLLRHPRIRRAFLACLRCFDPFSVKDFFERAARLVDDNAARSQAENFAKLTANYPAGTLFVVLPMDFDCARMGKAPECIEVQHAELLRLAQDCPGRIVPFCAVDPRRPDILDRVKGWVGQGFRGLKVYPPLGYYPRELMDVFRFAQEEGLPVISHCDWPIVRRRGLTASEAAVFTRPANYAEVLSELPRLRLCLAHFGGGKSWDQAFASAGVRPAGKDAPWVEQIVDLMRRHPCLYADISYTVFGGPKRLPYLKSLLAEPAIASRVLFGSDWYVADLEERKSEKGVCADLRRALGEELWERITFTNPREFLGPRGLEPIARERRTSAQETPEPVHQNGKDDADMSEPKTFEELVWDEIINAGTDGLWIDRSVAESKEHPDRPFADSGPIMERMLQLGVTREEIGRLGRAERYGACFQLLYKLGEEGMLTEEATGIYENLLTSDPSGMDGRPGSWPPSSGSPAPAPSNGKSQAGMPVPLLALKKVQHVAFSPDGARLLVGQSSIATGFLRLYEVPSGAEGPAFRTLPNLRDIAFSPDGSRVLAGAHSGSVCVHDSRTGDMLWKSKANDEEIHQVLFSTDGQYILSSGLGQSIRVRDAATGKELWSLDPGSGMVAHNMALSPDGTVLAVDAVVAGPGTQYLTLWDWRGNRQLKRYDRKGRFVSGLAYLPDGRHLAVTSSESVEVWDAIQGALETTLPIPESRVAHAALSPSGKLLVMLATDLDGHFYLWDLAARRLLMEVRFKGSWPHCTAFSPDGRYLALAADSRGYVWSVESLFAGS